MGNNLGFVELPTGFEIADLDVFGYAACVLSTNASVVCFGRNNRGELGIGNTESIGNEDGEMGDSLVAVDLGSDFIPAQLAGGCRTACALSTLGGVKC